ncbi:MAG: DUF1566 domain-containing protein [Legionella sp.]|nr:MAG: DUF1566 domain-containing protein [Legionella sp.]
MKIIIRIAALWLVVAMGFAAQPLTPSLVKLALSVKLYGALTGNPRQILITNTSPNLVTHLKVTSADLPKGTTISSTTCDNDLAANASCIIVVSPGSLPSVDDKGKWCTQGRQPQASTIRVTADDIDPLVVEVVVLNYGCIYQSGYVYAIDDSYAHYPISGSVGGKVTALKNQSENSPFGNPWSTDKYGDYDNGVSIWGIGETSTSQKPVPNADSIIPAEKVEGQSDCEGKLDGVCNTNNIVAYYSAPRSPKKVPTQYYAAGLCNQYHEGGYQDWYLPAICELGPSQQCIKKVQNMAQNLAILRSSNCTGSHCLEGVYWSSTQMSYVAKTYAWFQVFAARGESYAQSTVKATPMNVRCSRAIT